MSEKKTLADLIQEKKKKKNSEIKTKRARFTALDFFLVVVILLCVFGIGFRGTIAEFFLKVEPTQEVVISFKTNADNLTKNEVDGIVAGKEFFFDEKHHNRLGVIADVIVSQELMGYSATGHIVVDGRYTDSGLVSKSNRSIRVGETFNICSGNYTVCVQITEIPRK